VALPANHICRALESKLERDGAPALTAAEWLLVKVGRCYEKTRSRLIAFELSDTPVLNSTSQRDAKSPAPSTIARAGFCRSAAARICPNPATELPEAARTLLPVRESGGWRHVSG
jgi:hypothetical protein